MLLSFASLFFSLFCYYSFLVPDETTKKFLVSFSLFFFLIFPFFFRSLSLFLVLFFPCVISLFFLVATALQLSSGFSRSFSFSLLFSSAKKSLPFRSSLSFPCFFCRIYFHLFSFHCSISYLCFVSSFFIAVDFLLFLKVSFSSFSTFSQSGGYFSGGRRT